LICDIDNTCKFNDETRSLNNKKTVCWQAETPCDAYSCANRDHQMWHQSQDHVLQHQQEQHK